MKTTFTFKSILPVLTFACVALCGASESSAQDAAGPAVVSANPASGTKVESLSEIVLTMNQETADAVNEWGMENVELPSVFGAPSGVEALLWYPQDDLTKLKITVTPALTQDGTYEINIPAGYIADKNSENFNMDIKLVYTIGSGTSGEELVQYDVNYISIEPGHGTYEALNTVTLMFDTDVCVPDEARAYLYQNNMVYKGVRMAVRDGNKVDLLFENFDTEGVYELVIEKAQIGDAKWMESHHLGHANPELKIPGYRIKQSVSKLTYDFTPVISPDGTDAVECLDKITLNFGGAWCSASDEAIALHDDMDGIYPLSVSLGETLSEAVLTPDFPIKDAGTYRLVVPKGRFGNSDYEETSGQEGALNPEITVSFDIDPSLGVRDTCAGGVSVSAAGGVLTLDGEGRASVYTVCGVMAADVEVSGRISVALCPGIYIVRTGDMAIKVSVR